MVKYELEKTNRNKDIFMIKYEIVEIEKWNSEQDNEILNYIDSLRKQSPFLVKIPFMNAKFYSIPVSKNISNNEWVFHREYGPALEYKWVYRGENHRASAWIKHGLTKWCWYGEEIYDAKTFFNLEWRKKTEMKIFI